MTLKLLALACLAARLGAAEAPALVPPMPASGPPEATAQPTPAPSPALAATPAPEPLSPVAEAWPDHGVEYRFSLGQLLVFNAAPLSYVPIEIGWRFTNHVRLRTGLEAFYYQGEEKDSKNGGQSRQYTYSMNNWRTTLLYEQPWTQSLQPLVGVTLEMLWGSRQYSSVPYGQPNPSASAWSGIGPGLLLGLQFRGGPHWGLSTTARYALALGAPGNVAGLDLGWDYLF